MNELERTAQQALRVLEDARLFNYSLKHAECNEMIARLRSVLDDAPSTAGDPSITHYDGCWYSGPAHYKCAKHQLSLLQSQVEDHFCDSHCTWTDHHPDCVYWDAQ